MTECSNQYESNSFNQRFQRDVNRVQDSDRNTRRRGLQNLLDSLPWNKQSEMEPLTLFVQNFLLKKTCELVADTVEKSRDLSLKLLEKYLDNNLDLQSSVDYIVVTLSNRVNTIPFPETSEELRYQISLILHKLLKTYNKCITIQLYDNVLKAMGKSLCDNFPNMKRSSAVCIQIIVLQCPEVIRMSYKTILEPLVINGSHQHSKTRLITLKTVSMVTTCIGEDYESIMTDLIFPLFSRLLYDSHIKIKLELAHVCDTLLTHRIDIKCMEWLTIDVQLLIILFLLEGDDSPEVKERASQGIRHVATQWYIHIYPLITTSSHKNKNQNRSYDDQMTVAIHMENDTDIVDGEYELQQQQQPRQQRNQCDNLLSIIDTKSTHLIQNTQDDAMIMDDTSAIPVPESLLSEQTIVSKLSDIPISQQISILVYHYSRPCLDILLQGIHNWTHNSRLGHLRGLNEFIRHLGSEYLSIYLVDIYTQLCNTILDDELMIRQVSELCCRSIGTLLPAKVSSDILFARASGTSPGTDTSSQRSCSILVLNQVINGYMTQVNNVNSNEDYDYILQSCCHVLISTNIFQYKDTPIREAILVLLKTLLTTLHTVIHKSLPYQRDILFSLLYLQGMTSSSSRDNLIQDTAIQLMNTLAMIASDSYDQNLIISEINKTISTSVKPSAPTTTKSSSAIDINTSSSSSSSSLSSSVEASAAHIKTLLSTHFTTLLQSLSQLITQSTTTTTTTSDINHKTSTSSTSSNLWSTENSHIIAYNILLRIAPYQAWVHITEILDFITPQIQPKKLLDPQSAEYLSQSYASQRGEEVIPNIDQIDIRLYLLILLEVLIREGAADWTCSRYIAQSMVRIIQYIIIPNLVWRAGRVEGTMRKVALAICHSLLKAGAVEVTSLFHIATDLVPLLISHTDDSEITTRLIACYCLKILFERLKGAFSEQAIHEIYPKLLKRLDDSSDQIRTTICDTLIVFFHNAPKSYYMGTLIDYSMDQLFIHLDDSNPSIQEAVCHTIIQIASLDKEKVLNKAEHALTTHRTSHYCQRIINEMQGYEIVES